MAHLGLIIVQPPTPDELEVARFQGRRVAQVARALKAAGQTATKENAQVEATGH